VHDFRSADVAAGGHGAPFVPVYHAALVAHLPKPLAVLNLGGVANVTWIGEAADDMLAFDTGPANALIDDWMHAHTGKAFDKDGATAATGYVHKDVLTAMLDNPWFDATPPKSLDRSDFSNAAARGLSVADGAATLTAFTAETVALAREHMAAPPVMWLVAGGGRLNATLMDMLRARLGVPVQSVDAYGMDGDAVEGQAFAYMAVRSMKGLPLSFPGTTGVTEPQTGGVLCEAA
jgi:anhydro-N-acetylmuramic acid kinase